MLRFWFLRRHHGEGRQPLATSVLLGIWVLAPTMITLGTSFAGAGFRSGLVSVVTVIFATALFPIFALMMAGYDLTIPALLLVTIMLVGARFAFERRTSRESGGYLKGCPIRRGFRRMRTTNAAIIDMCDRNY